jgi:hypothetical protein
MTRAQRLRDMLAAVEEWRHASGGERRIWRRSAMAEIRDWRTLYAIPERAAFEAAVAAQHRRNP